MRSLPLVAFIVVVLVVVVGRRRVHVVHLHLGFEEIFRRRDQREQGRAGHSGKGVSVIPPVFAAEVLRSKVRVGREGHRVDDGQRNERRTDSLVHGSDTLRSNDVG